MGSSGGTIEGHHLLVGGRDQPTISFFIFGHHGSDLSLFAHLCCLLWEMRRDDNKDGGGGSLADNNSFAFK